MIALDLERQDNTENAGAGTDIPNAIPIPNYIPAFIPEPMMFSNQDPAQTRSAPPPPVKPTNIIKPILKFNAKLNWCAVSTPTENQILVLIFNAAVCAAFGAASGAIGFAVLNSAGWQVPGLNGGNLTQAGAVGGAVLVPISSIATDYLLARVDSACAKDLIKAADLSRTLTSGVLFTLTGAAILKLLNGGEQVGYSAAAGGTGGIIFIGSCEVGLKLLQALCVSSAYAINMCCNDEAGSNRCLM